MACPSPGEDIFVDEEAQDHDISHFFYLTTKSAVGLIYTWLVMLIRILSRSCGLGGMNGRFNCGETAGRRTRTCLPEQTPSSSPRTSHIRDLNNDNPASSKNVRGLALFSSFPPRSLPTKLSMRVRATLRKLTLEFLVRVTPISNSQFSLILPRHLVCRPHSWCTRLTSTIFTKTPITQDRFCSWSAKNSPELHTVFSHPAPSLSANS